MPRNCLDDVDDDKPRGWRFGKDISDAMTSYMAGTVAHVVRCMLF